MDREFEELKSAFTEVIKKCIEMKWITVNEHISYDGLASQFANKMHDIQEKKHIEETIGRLVWTRTWHRDKFNDIMQLFREEETKSKAK